MLSVWMLFLFLIHGVWVFKGMILKVFSNRVDSIFLKVVGELPMTPFHSAWL